MLSTDKGKVFLKLTQCFLARVLHIFAAFVYVDDSGTSEMGIAYCEDTFVDLQCNLEKN